MSVTLTLIALIGFMWFSRRVWFGFHCVGAFTMFYLVMNYVGIVVLAFGFDIGTEKMFHTTTTEDYHAAFYVATVGLASLIGGAVVSTMILGMPRRLPNLPPNIPLGFRTDLLTVLAMVYVALFLLYVAASWSTLYAMLTGGFWDRFNYRMTETSRIPRYVVQLTYNILPYVGMCCLAIVVFQKKFRPWLLIVWGMGAVGRMILLQKWSLILYILLSGCCIAFGLSRKKLHKLRKLSLGLIFRLTGAVAFAFLILSGLYAWLYDTSRMTSAADVVELGLENAYVHLVLRGANCYVLVVKYVPEALPHYGFSNVDTLMKMIGRKPVEVNSIIYQFESSEAVQVEGGSIASDSIVNYYGGFGWAGLVILSFLQGTFLAWLERWLMDRPQTVSWFVCHLFMMEASVELTGQHIFGAALGYGGIIFLLHGLILSSSVRNPAKKKSRFVSQRIPQPQLRWAGASPGRLPGPRQPIVARRTSEPAPETGANPV